MAKNQYQPLSNTDEHVRQEAVSQIVLVAAPSVWDDPAVECADGNARTVGTQNNVEGQKVRVAEFFRSVRNIMNADERGFVNPASACICG